jgi:hypothetical protein
MRLLCNVLLKYFRLGRLRVAKIHHFVEKFVDDHKIIPDRFFLQNLEILCKDIYNLMEKKQYFGSIGVPFCKGKEEEIVVPYVEILVDVRPHVLVYTWKRTFMPSSEKHGGTAELSSSASLKRTGNLSTADMGMSPL